MPGRRPSRRAVIWSVVTLLVAVRLVVTVFGFHLKDFEVYWRAAVDLRTGAPIYSGPRFLPFTYPPFAAVVYLPFGLLPLSVAQWVHFVESALCAVLVLGLLRAHDGSLPLWWLGLAVLTLPVLRTLQLGQVNLLVFALVLIDVLVLPPRWRGVLLGVAAGLKLTPAFLVLVYVLRGDWAAVARCAVVAAATVGVGWAVAPDASASYWLRLLWQTGRVGDPGYADNQSLVGALLRLGPGGLTTVVTAVFVAAALVVGLLAARRRTRAGDDMGALIVVMLTSTLVLPISWTHHWLGALLLAAHLWPRRPRRSTGLLLLLSLEPAWIWERFSQGSTGLVYGSLTATYTVVGLVAVTVLALGGRLPGRPGSATGVSAAS